MVKLPSRARAVAHLNGAARLMVKQPPQKSIPSVTLAPELLAPAKKRLPPKVGQLTGG